jgi:hypothetical protein
VDLDGLGGEGFGARLGSIRKAVMNAKRHDLAFVPRAELDLPEMAAN